jgi:hypothetical protein
MDAQEPEGITIGPSAPSKTEMFRGFPGCMSVPTAISRLTATGLPVGIPHFYAEVAEEPHHGLACFRKQSVDKTSAK